MDELPGRRQPSQSATSADENRTAECAAEDTTSCDATLQRRTLLDIYSLPTPSKAAFATSAGQEPGFADLDLVELEQYVRVAHYRARVLAHRHLDVKQLDAEHVKPQWLLAIEKIEAMVVHLHEQQQQHIHDDADATDADDSRVATRSHHLTQIHSRVLFQLAALLKQYKREFGDTMFTRQLRSLIKRLSNWKVDQIPALLAALDVAKAAGVSEEKQRNLEFYHVHEGARQTGIPVSRVTGDDACSGSIVKGVV